MFRDALAATGEPVPHLMDIAQLTARALPQGELKLNGSISE
jgi:hypothetical protein